MQNNRYSRSIRMNHSLMKIVEDIVSIDTSNVSNKELEQLFFRLQKSRKEQQRRRACERHI
jgi:hypothetical protein